MNPIASSMAPPIRSIALPKDVADALSEAMGSGDFTGSITIHFVQSDIRGADERRMIRVPKVKA